MNSIIDICKNETSKDPIYVLRVLMSQPFCHMHGPEHHTLVGAALLTAYKNSGGDIDLEPKLIELMNRAKQVPGGACGLWGACGAGISTGMVMSLITEATPFTVNPWRLSNEMTSKSLKAIGQIGGPRCCKRDSYMAIISATEFISDNLGVDMDRQEVKCIHSDINAQCIKERCPFYKG